MRVIRHAFLCQSYTTQFSRIARNYTGAASPSSQTDKKADIKLLSKLRKATSQSFIHCQEALLKNDNDYEKSIEWLKQQAAVYGRAKLEKLEGRQTNQGAICLYSPNRQTSVLMQVAAETDFASTNEIFCSFVKHLGDEIIKSGPYTATTGFSLMTLDPLKILQENNGALQTNLVECVGKIGEKVEFKKGNLAYFPDGKIGTYVHSQYPNYPFLGKIAGWVAVDTKSENEELLTFLDNLACHIVGCPPTYIYDSEIPEGQVVEDDMVLMRQSFLFSEAGETVEQCIKKLEEANGPIKVVGYSIFRLSDSNDS